VVVSTHGVVLADWIYPAIQLCWRRFSPTVPDWIKTNLSGFSLRGKTTLQWITSKPHDVHPGGVGDSAQFLHAVAYTLGGLAQPLDVHDHIAGGHIGTDAMTD
jgi:hypothetical protein